MPKPRHRWCYIVDFVVFPCLGCQKTAKLRLYLVLWNVLNLSLSTKNSLDMSKGCPNLWTSWWAGVEISRWHRDSSIAFCLTEPLFLARLAYSIFWKCNFGVNQSRLIVPALGPKWFFQEVILAHVLEQTHFIISMLKVCGRGFCWCHDVGSPCYCAWVRR